MKSCYERGIPYKMISLLKWMGQFMTTKRVNLTINLDDGDAINMDTFGRGPILTLILFYPIIILEFIFEYNIKYLMN